MSTRLLPHAGPSLALLLALSCQSTPVSPEATSPGAARPRSTPESAKDLRAPLVVTQPFALATRPIEEAAAEAAHLRELRQLTWVGRSGDARFDPSGRRLYYLSLRAPAATEQLYFFDLRGGREHLLDAAGHDVAGPCALDHGLLFARREAPGRGTRLMQLDDGAPSAHLVDATRALLDPFDATLARVSGEIFLSAGEVGQRRLYVLAPGLRELRPLLAADVSDDSPSPSPDGRRVAFVRHMPSGETRIMLLDRDRRQVSTIAGLPGSNSAPALHPTAPLIVFASSFYGERDIELFMVATDSGAVTRLTYHAGFDSLPDFDADGQHLSFTSSRQGGVPQIFIARFEP